MFESTRTAAPPRTLVEGQRLDQPTFHALYEAMPPETRAELIDGVVYIPSPVGFEHSDAQIPVIFWFGQENGVLVQRPIGADGLYRSPVFPGLWLDPQALLQGNRQRLRAVLDLGRATSEHTEFVARLANARSVS
jgi:hypothetical protein